MNVPSPRVTKPASRGRASTELATPGGFGKLEAAVMDVVWKLGVSLRVRDVLEHLDTSREPAYTTVMTVMDNLYRKGWLIRELDGRAYRYAATRTRMDAATDALRTLLEHTGDPSATLLHFARGATEAESTALARGLKERPRRR